MPSAVPLRLLLVHVEHFIQLLVLQLQLLQPRFALSQHSQQQVLLIFHSLRLLNALFPRSLQFLFGDELPVQILFALSLHFLRLHAAVFLPLLLRVSFSRP